MLLAEGYPAVARLPLHKNFYNSKSSSFTFSTATTTTTTNNHRDLLACLLASCPPTMVKQSIDAKVRPLANAGLEKASLFGAARLYISKDSMIALTNGLESNKACVVEKLPDDSAPDWEPVKREASLCVLPEKNLSPNVVMMTRAFQDASGFRVGDQVRISLLEATPDADEVVVRNMTEGSEAEASKPTKYQPCWEYSLGLSLGTVTKQTLKTNIY